MASKTLSCFRKKTTETCVTIRYTKPYGVPDKQVWLRSFSSRIARRQTPTQTMSNRSLMQVQRVPQLKIASHSDKKQCRANAFGTLIQSAAKHRQLLPCSTAHKYERFVQFGVIRNRLRISPWTEFRHTAARHQGLL